MLNLYRRHLQACGRSKRRSDCSCPVWVQGVLNGHEIRKSLGIRNWAAAQKIVRDWEMRPEGFGISIKEAWERFLADCEARNIGDAQMGKYRLLEREMVGQFGHMPVNGVTVDELSKFRESWKLAPVTAQKKVERMRTFFRFCEGRDWCAKNPASRDRLTIGKFKRRQVQPFSDDEMGKIIEALDKYPDSPPGRRLQVRAFVLALRYTGMRIRDVVSLAREKVTEHELVIQTHKTGAVVRLPLHDVVVEPLEAVSEGGAFFFWSGNGLVKSAVADWQRTLGKLFEIAGVHKGHAHRFRHTFAVKLLSKGVAVNHVAAILGNSPAVVEKHYSAWVQSRQEALNEAVRATFTD